MVAGSASSAPDRGHERNDGSMNGKPEGDAMRPEYDFSGGVRGKHYRAYRRGTAIVPSKTGAEMARGTNEDALREALHTIEEHREDAGEMDSGWKTSRSIWPRT